MRLLKIPFQPEENVYLELYLHEKANEKRPIVLVFPGGGYEYCSEHEGMPIAQAYFNEGYHSGILHYHVGEYRNFSKALEDANQAVGYLKANHEALYVDKEKIAVLGFSAGGHLAAACSNLAAHTPSLCLLGYPAILDSLNPFMGIEAPSLEKVVSKNTPPTFLFSTYHDDLVPIENSLRYIAALEDNDVPFEAHIFEKGRHGLGLGEKGAIREESASIAYMNWLSMSFLWLKTHWENDDYLSPVENFEETPLKNLMNDRNSQTLIEVFPFLEERALYKIARLHSLQELNKIQPQLFPWDKVEELKGKLTGNGCD